MPNKKFTCDIHPWYCYGVFFYTGICYFIKDFIELEKLGDKYKAFIGVKDINGTYYSIIES